MIERKEKRSNFFQKTYSYDQNNEIMKKLPTRPAHEVHRVVGCPKVEKKLPLLEVCD